jgi:hypothetical protein
MDSKKLNNFMVILLVVTCIVLALSLINLSHKYEKSIIEKTLLISINGDLSKRAGEANARFFYNLYQNQCTFENEKIKGQGGIWTCPKNAKFYESVKYLEKGMTIVP